MNGLAVVKNDLVETYSETSFQTDLTNFLAYMKQHGRKETTIRTYDSAIRSVYDRMKDNDGMLHRSQSDEKGYGYADAGERFGINSISR